MLAGSRWVECWRRLSLMLVRQRRRPSAVGDLPGLTPVSLAATLTSYISKKGNVVAVLTGEIVPGDMDQLQQIIRSPMLKEELSQLSASTLQAETSWRGAKLAEAIRFAKMTSVVPNGSAYASTCLIAFAAGADKFTSCELSLGCPPGPGRGSWSCDASAILGRTG